MTDKIKELIKSSRAIKDSEKAMYSKLAEFLDEANQNQLLKIFQLEAEGIQKIQAEADLEKSTLNQSFVLSLDEFFKSEQKKAIQSKEHEESIASEDILKKLDND